MPKVRAGGAKRWAERASQSTNEYTAGIMNPRRDWEQATIEAEGAYKEGIQKALSDGRFAKGVKKAGSAKQKEKAVEKGRDRFASGVLAGESDYDAGVAPYLQVIESTKLPPRYAKGDQRNFERGKTIAMALRRKKVGAG